MKFNECNWIGYDRGGKKVSFFYVLLFINKSNTEMFSLKVERLGMLRIAKRKSIIFGF